MRDYESIKLLGFDSELFEKNIASYSVLGDLNYSQLKNEIKTNKIDLLYLFSSTSLNDDIVEKNLGVCLTYVDEKIVFEKKVEINNSQKRCSDIMINQWEQSDIALLKSLAIASGEFSRFFRDPKIKIDKAQELYLIWLAKSLSFDIADQIIIAGKDKPKGMLTVKFSQNLAVVGLLAVDKNCRGQGIARQLLTSLEQNCIKKGIDVISIPTQRINENACKFYLKSGFSEVDSSFVHHCWKSHE